MTVRRVAILVLIAAAVLSGCGRKGDPTPPPPAEEDSGAPGRSMG